MYRFGVNVKRVLVRSTEKVDDTPEQPLPSSSTFRRLTARDAARSASKAVGAGTEESVHRRRSICPCIQGRAGGSLPLALTTDVRCFRSPLSNQRLPKRRGGMSCHLEDVGRQPIHLLAERALARLQLFV